MIIRGAFGNPDSKTYLTETDIVERLWKGCPTLCTDYQLYQDFLYAVRKRDYVSFEKLLTSNEILSEGDRTTLRTLQKFLSQIKNALQRSYSNRPRERLNNSIKLLKQTAYGFRSFYNFKLHIMIRHGSTLILN